MFSLGYARFAGSEPSISRARERLASLGGLELLRGMMRFDASARPSMLDALTSDLFSSLRAADALGAVRGADFAFTSFL